MTVFGSNDIRKQSCASEYVLLVNLYRLNENNKIHHSSARASATSKSVLSWVAVVELMHLLGANRTSDPSSSCARVRLRTPALPNIHDRQKAEKELIESVATELLNQAKINSSDNDVNPNKYQINQPEYSDLIAA